MEMICLLKKYTIRSSINIKWVETCFKIAEIVIILFYKFLYLDIIN